MSDTLQYKLEVGVSDSINVEDFEEFLQALLLDLYEQGDVESITVKKDGYVYSKDDDIERLLETMDELDSEHIKAAIETVNELERDDDG
jgi:hypothetical protein